MPRKAKQSKRSVKILSLGRRQIRRSFWIGEISFEEAMMQLMNEEEHDMSEYSAKEFLGDNTSLDAEAQALMKQNCIPFGVSLVQPSIILS